jgi:vacuolar-type H+-ATPase subunit H
VAKVSKKELKTDSEIDKFLQDMSKKPSDAKVEAPKTEVKAEAPKSEPKAEQKLNVNTTS